VLFAVASLNCFAAPACIGSGTLATFASNGACTITNGSYAWTLQNFGVSSSSSTGFAGVVMTDSGLQLTLAPTGPNGFSMTYSGTGSGAPLFSWNNQDVNWVNGIWITAENVLSNIDRIAFANTHGTGNAYMSLEKEIQNQFSTELAPSLTAVYPAGAAAGTNVINSGTGLNASNLSLNDRLVFDAKTDSQTGTLRSGSLNSYTNSVFALAPQAEVPEPTSFVLVGLSLVGIALLRRKA
jgi:hypothetical protein